MKLRCQLPHPDALLPSLHILHLTLLSTSLWARCPTSCSCRALVTQPWKHGNTIMTWSLGVNGLWSTFTQTLLWVLAVDCLRDLLYGAEIFLPIGQLCLTFKLQGGPIYPDVFFCKVSSLQWFLFLMTSLNNLIVSFLKNLNLSPQWVPFYSCTDLLGEIPVAVLSFLNLNRCMCMFCASESNNKHWETEEVHSELEWRYSGLWEQQGLGIVAWWV